MSSQRRPRKRKLLPNPLNLDGDRTNHSETREQHDGQQQKYARDAHGSRDPRTSGQHEAHEEHGVSGISVSGAPQDLVQDHLDDEGRRDENQSDRQGNPGDEVHHDQRIHVVLEDDIEMEVDEQQGYGDEHFQDHGNADVNMLEADVDFVEELEDEDDEDLDEDNFPESELCLQNHFLATSPANGNFSNIFFGRFWY